MRSRIYTIIKGHFKSWYRSKSNIFWTIAFPLLLIVLFGAIFGSGSTKFDLYLQNQDLNANAPTLYSHGYINALNNTGAFNLHVLCRPALLWSMGARSEPECDGPSHFVTGG